MGLQKLPALVRAVSGGKHEFEVQIEALATYYEYRVRVTIA